MARDNNPNPIPEASAEHEPAELDPETLSTLELGPPFAIAHDAMLLKPDAQRGIPGCFATLKCDSCGQAFKLDLLADGLKKCPGCPMRYTHALLICEHDDETMVEEALELIFAANGFGGQPAEPEEDSGELTDEEIDADLERERNDDE